MIRLYKTSIAQAQKRHNEEEMKFFHFCYYNVLLKIVAAEAKELSDNLTSKERSEK